MKIVWTEQALSDLSFVLDYADSKSRNSSAFIAKRIKKTIGLLVFNPEMGRKGRVRNTRELIILNSPFIVVYTLQEIRHRKIVLVAIIHTSRKWPESF